MKQMDWNKVWGRSKFYREGNFDWRFKENYFHRRMFDYFKGKIKNKNIKVLDCGCAPGNWARWFREEFNARVFGVDISKIGLDQSKKKVPDGKFVIADVRKTPFKNNTFDLIYHFGLIEHFDDFLPILKENYRILKKGGKIILTVPNNSKPSLTYYYDRLRYGKKTTERPVAPEELKENLIRAGFKNVNVEPIGLFIPHGNKLIYFLNLKPLENRITAGSYVGYGVK